jgi:glycosyltransferase involved in cell wall biosynthesis
VSGNESWILKSICKEIQRYGWLNGLHLAEGYRLPWADYYFFAHYSRLIQFLESPKNEGKRIVWFPHFEESGKRQVEDVINALHGADKIICPASFWKAWLLNHGLSGEKVVFVLGGADPEMFHYHERSGNTVGFVSKYYPRKNPDTILQIIQCMPDRKFILLGHGWKQYPRFADLYLLPNFRYIQTDYANYPSIYAQMDVFVSVSRVEGGPIPLIEAMMSNVVPVASRTGFAPDIIRHGENGFIFDVDVDVATIVSLIHKAFKLKTNVRETVKRLTWENFVKQLLDFVYK